MTARTVLGSSVGLLIAASAAGGCGGRVDDAASGKTGEPPVVRILGAGGTGSSKSVGSGVGGSRAVQGGGRDGSSGGAGGGGSGSAGGGGSGSAGAVFDANSAPAAFVDAGQDAATTADAGHEDPVEVWVGQVEHKVTSLGNNGPDAPPEHVVVALSRNDGVPGGSIVFGNAPPPPKATDPDAFYPPITPASTYSEQEVQLTDMIQRPFDGQPYSLFNVHRSDARLTFEVMPSELWTDWCALQPKTYFLSERPDATYSCVPSPSAGATAELGKDFLCLGTRNNHPCECDEKSCHADLSFGWVVDLELRGDSLEGLTYLTQAATGIWANGVKLRRVH